MKYVIIFLEGKQFLIPLGKSQIFRLKDQLNLNKGDFLFLNKLLAIRKKSHLSMGKPFVINGGIFAIFLKKLKGPKLIILKTRPKKNYTKRKGYREIYHQFFIQN